MVDVLKVRKATEEDIPEILRLSAAAWKELKGTPVPEKALLDVQNELWKSFYVALADGKIVGMRSAVPNYKVSFRHKKKEHFPEEKSVLLGNAYTIPEYRSLGISRGIWNRIERDFKGKGYAFYVAIESPQMFGFWKRRGFGEAGECTSCDLHKKKGQGGNCRGKPLLRRK